VSGRGSLGQRRGQIKIGGVVVIEGEVRCDGSVRSQKFKLPK